MLLKGYYKKASSGKAKRRLRELDLSSSDLRFD
jgi:hypothetical protein